MRGVILAGGLGTRLRPLTTVLNKHTLPVFDKPMIFFPLQMLAEAGIEEVVMVIGGHGTEELVKLCKDGREFGFRRLYYVYQEGEGGIAAALSLTEQFVHDDDCCVVLGDNLMLGDKLNWYKKSFEDMNAPLETYDAALQTNEKKAMVLLAEVPDPENYGVPTIEKGGRVIMITEKPEKPMSKFGVIGVYFYPADVFQKIRECQPSERGELEITDVNNLYAQEGRLAHMVVKGTWVDAGSSIQAWLAAGKLVEKARKKEEILERMAT